MENDAQGVTHVFAEVVAGGRHRAGTQAHGTDDGATDEGHPAFATPTAVGQAADTGGAQVPGRDGCGTGGEQRREVRAGLRRLLRDEGLELLDQRVAQGRGVLLFGSHQGSFEALRAIGARRPKMPLRVVLDKQKTPAMTELLEALAPDVGACVIDAAQDGTTIALAMAEACHDGALVAMLADRGRGHEVLRRTGFLGSSAPFPISPWLLAHTLQVPVVLCFGLYLGGNRYKLVFEPFSERVHIPRHDRGPALDALIARYAQRLEHYIHVAPYNWFNFYDFWQDAPVADGPAAAAVGERVGV